MRKIEKELLSALSRDARYSNGNTLVTYDPVIGGFEAQVFLHGHLIAKRYLNGTWGITLAGWNTVTTRSRLSAILREFVPGVYGVGTKQGQAFIAYANHKRNIDDNEWVNV